MPLKSDSNVIITEQLTERLQRIEKQTGGDVLVLCVPIRIGIDNFVRDALEAIQNKKEKISVVLETGGGYIEVTQRIAHTLRHHYGVVDFIIPNCAYSAGTVLVMSGDAIWMDYYSVLGPIDPQLPKDDKMVPALGYLEQYRRLVEKSQQGKLTTAELAYLIQRFDPAELYKYEQARDLSVSLLREWLVKYKFKNWAKTKTRQKKVTQQMKVKRAEEIAMALNKIDKWNSHGRGIPMVVLQNDLKLEIEDFGKNEELNAAIRDYYKLLSDYLATVRLNYTIQTRENFWRVG
jgi:membrane-bound ClpP family serine protease